MDIMQSRLTKWRKKWLTPQTLWGGAALLAVGLVYFFFGCPIRRTLGFGCPGCGMTRALWCAATLRFSEAFACHPLFWLLPPMVWLVLSRRMRDHARLRNVLLGVMGTAFIVVWLLRMFVFHSPVVAPVQPGAEDYMPLVYMLHGLP